MSFLKASPGRQRRGLSLPEQCQLKGLGTLFKTLPLLGLDSPGGMLFPLPHFAVPCLIWHSSVDQASPRLAMRTLPLSPDGCAPLQPTKWLPPTPIYFVVLRIELRGLVHVNQALSNRAISQGLLRKSSRPLSKTFTLRRLMLRSRERSLVLSGNTQISAAEDRIEAVHSTFQVALQVNSSEDSQGGSHSGLHLFSVGIHMSLNTGLFPG